MFNMHRLGIISGYALFFFWTLFPIGWLFLTSVKPQQEAFRLPPTWAFSPTLDAYRAVLQNPDVVKAFVNSSIVSIGSTLVVLALALPAGYGFSRFRFRGRDTIAFGLLIARMFPPVVIVPAVFGFLRASGTYDTVWILVLLYASFTVSLSTWMMKSFFDDVPVHIEEAALVDGYTLSETFARVTLPLAAPGIVATSIFTFILSWNEFFFAFMFTSERAKTAPVEFVAIFMRESGVQWHLMAAGACLLMLPTLSLSWIIQKYFVKGLGVGAVKG